MMKYRYGLLFICLLLATVATAVAQETAKSVGAKADEPSLDRMRITMDKWIETQQIVSKESKDWQQGKEILTSRLELVKKEIDTLQAKIEEAETGVHETDAERAKLLNESDNLKTAADELTSASTVLERSVVKLSRQLPDPIATKLQPLYQRIPQDPAKTRVSVAERFQNILGILNELNKANNEISLNYEVHNLADGKPAEVQAIYIGLAQAYYVSARGEAGIGRPGPDGWQWNPSRDAAANILTALEILQGKHTPAFVPLPVKIQ